MRPRPPEVTFDPSRAGRAARNVRPSRGSGSRDRAAPVAMEVRSDQSARRAPRHRPGRPGGRVPAAVRLRRWSSAAVPRRTPARSSTGAPARSRPARTSWSTTRGPAATPTAPWSSSRTCAGSTRTCRSCSRSPGVGLSGFDDEPTHGVVRAGGAAHRRPAARGDPAGDRGAASGRRVGAHPAARPAPRDAADSRARRRWPVAARPACATLSRHDGCRAGLGGRVPGVLGRLAWIRRRARRPASRSCATATPRDRSSTRPARSTRASGCGWRRATSSLAVAWLGIAMYGMYLATVGMEAWA